jgi:hypothetical protein
LYFECIGKRDVTKVYGFGSQMVNNETMRELNCIGASVIERIYTEVLAQVKITYFVDKVRRYNELDSNNVKV